MHELFMRRCFDLAVIGRATVAPNPMVGAVIVHQNRIIGEGWHQQYGGPHAEVHAIRSAPQHLLAQSTLYCSLEPCYHYGKTPPCVDLVIEHKIPRVVIANTDPNPLVAGQSIRKMREHGIEVVTGILEEEGIRLNRSFFTWITQKRPYIILKWAQSTDGYLGKEGVRTAISGPVTRRLVHRWRTEVDAILVGTQTALVDNPQLDSRYYPGKNPLRIVPDFYQKIPDSAHLLDDSMPTWIIGPERAGAWTQTVFQSFSRENMLPELLAELYAQKKATLLVEGGSNMLQSFIDAGLWDENPGDYKSAEGVEWWGESAGLRFTIWRFTIYECGGTLLYFSLCQRFLEGLRFPFDILRVIAQVFCHRFHEFPQMLSSPSLRSVFLPQISQIFTDFRLHRFKACGFGVGCSRLLVIYWLW